MKHPGRIPIVVIAGFLGAGKTTVLNHLIQQAPDQKIVVLVNDFGSINIDSEIVFDVEGTTVSLANGCVCCTINGDLARAGLDILGFESRPDLVLVELSGVSDPGPVVNTFLETELRSHFNLTAVVTVVDVAGWQGLAGETRDLAHAQVCAADIVALTKSDMVSRQAAQTVTKQLNDSFAGAIILDAPRGRLPLGLLTDRSFEHVPGRQGPAKPHGLATWSFRHAGRPISLPALERFLSSPPPGIVRMKGFVWIEELPNLRFLLQAVGNRYDITCLGDWTGKDPETSLVLIGQADAITPDRLRSAMVGCLATGDRDASPILRLVQRIAPELLERPVA